MKYASYQDVISLIDKPNNSQAISIFLPLNRASIPQTLKAVRIRLKNAIKDMEADLKTKISKQELSSYTEQIKKLAKDSDFWKRRDKGIAMYIKENKLAYYDLSIEIGSRVHVGDYFVITPLLVSMQLQHSYYLLDLNLDEPRFFLGSQSELTRILIDEMPGPIRTALQLDEFQQNLQHGTNKQGGKATSFHGHGAKKDNHAKDVERYYRLIDSILWRTVLNKSNRSLLIAGDTSAIATYESLSKYRHIHSKKLEGSFEKASEKELHEASWNIMLKLKEKDESLAKNIIDKARKRDKKQVLVNGKYIREAAKRGRVDRLFLSLTHYSYDSVVSRIEKRFKIELPSSTRQLRNIEATTREVIKTGGHITPILYGKLASSPNQTGYIHAITR